MTSNYLSYTDKKIFFFFIVYIFDRKRNEKTQLAFSILYNCVAVFSSLVALFQLAWFITGSKF